MSFKPLAFLLLIFLPLHYCHAQTDSLQQNLQNIPKKYLAETQKKASKYAGRLADKTERTLTKLSRWELKLLPILQKVNPEAASRLFSPSSPSFTTALEKYREGKAVTEGYKARYDRYTDDVTTQLKYLEEKKELLDKKYQVPLKEAKQSVTDLQEKIESTEAITAFIKERKAQLMQEAFKHLGQHKYLQKINKEAFYYTETLLNYKDVFNNPKKAEETAKTILNKIPFFQKFMQENSMLASLFGSPGGSGSSSNTASLVGLQTRASVNSLIQDRISSGGPSARQQVQQNIQQAQAEMSKLKDKLLKAGSGSMDGEMPDFKPNMQKTKTLAQRMEYGFSFQPIKSSSLLPGGVDVGLSIGYKINDKSVAGVGASYKFSMGSIDKLRFSHEGISLRSFIDWKLKKQFFLSGGFEMNHFTSFKNVSALRQMDAWQQSGLLGISKKIPAKSKLMKAGKLQLLFDFLYKQHLPVSQPVAFRVGYTIK